MDSARAWLDVGGLLDRTAPADLQALAPASAGSDGLELVALAHLRAIQDELAAQNQDQNQDQNQNQTQTQTQTQTQDRDPRHAELISIAIDDMKVVTALMKLFTVFGLYPYVPDASMVPLGPRIAWPLPPKRASEAGPDQSSPELARTVDALVAIVLRGDDLASLVLVSPFLVDLLAAAGFFPARFAELVQRTPTFTLYKLLVQLRARPAPPPAVVRTLGELPLFRSDAVRTLLELVIEPKTQSDSAELGHADKAAQVLAAVPAGMPKVAYIRSVGSQLYALLAGSAGNTIADAAARVVAALSESQPRLVGELRNLLVHPLESSGTQATSSLAAMLRLGESTQAQHSGLFAHVAARVCAAVWLLVDASKASSPVGELDSAYVALQARILESSPETNIKSVVAAFTSSTLPNTRLAWTGLEARSSRPALMETVGTPASAENQSLSQLIDARLDNLVTILAKVSDVVATTILTFVLQWYVNGAAEADPLTSIVLAKTVERLAKDTNLRPKLFSDPDQIVQLAFRLITANMAQPSQPPMSSLHIADDIDSDDEDDYDYERWSATAAVMPRTGAQPEDVQSRHSQPKDAQSEESLTLIELSLSLLGSALMESLGGGEEGQPKISNDQSILLDTLSRHASKSIGSKAEFCLQLIDGSRREQKEVDMNNDADVLAAARMALQEPLVPSRAYGLYLFTKLVERHAVSLEVAMSVFLDELSNDDSYVYLNAIKGIEAAARAEDSSRVLSLLIPAISSDRGHIDAVLRAREALVRVISPGTATRLSADLVETLLSDLRASARSTRDIRFRLSSCSLLGIIISQYPHALSGSQENDAADCALGILRYEQAPEEQALRKAAVIMALEIVNAVNEGAFASGLAKATLASLVTEIESIMRTTDDTVLLDHCRAVMESAGSTV